MVDDTPDVAAPSLFRRTLIRVMTMQVVTLLILGLIQLRYNS